MIVKVKGQFLENGHYHSAKTDTDVNYTTMLVGSSALQVKGVHMPQNVKRLDDIELTVDLRAYGSQLSATFVNA